MNNRIEETGKGAAIAGAGMWGLGSLVGSSLLTTLWPWGLGIWAVTWGASKAIKAVFGK